MRIFYDGFIYDYQPYGGINRYFNEIISRLPGDSTPIVSTYLGRRENWPSHPRLSLLRSKPFARWPALESVGKAWMQVRLVSSPRDLVHPTYYQMLTPGGMRAFRGPVVVTVHDMIHEIFAESIDREGQIARAKAESVERADAILCNSENTRADLVERFPTVASRCVVTPLASSMIVDADALAAAPPVARPFCVYVGGRESYKNFAFLLRTWAKFHALRPDVQLHVVGSQWLPAERALLAELQLGDAVVHRGQAEDTELAVLYRQSLALVYPSLYEGFGIPPLEAMRCGTAVICAATSSVPEVCGDAPLYFDPRDAEMLLVRLLAITDSDDVRRACIERGSVRAQLFSWERTAAQTLEVYRSLVN